MFYVYFNTVFTPILVQHDLGGHTSMLQVYGHLDTCEAPNDISPICLKLGTHVPPTYLIIFLPPLSGSPLRIQRDTATRSSRICTNSHRFSA
jgi:hypothetical protein